MARQARLSWRQIASYEWLVGRRVVNSWREAIGRDALIVAITMALAAIGGGDSSVGAAWSGVMGAVGAILFIAFARGAAQSARIYYEQKAEVAEASKVISFRRRLLRHRAEFDRVRGLSSDARIISEALRRKQTTFMRFVSNAIERGRLEPIVKVDQTEPYRSFRDLCEELDARHPGEIQRQSDVGSIDLTKDPPLTVDDVGAAQLIDMSIQAVALLASDHVLTPGATTAPDSRASIVRSPVD